MTAPTPPPAERCGIEFYGLLCSRDPGHDGQHIHRSDRLTSVTTTPMAACPDCGSLPGDATNCGPSVGPVGDLPDEAVEAAAKAIKDLRAQWEAEQLDSFEGFCVCGGGPPVLDCGSSAHRAAARVARGGNHA